MMMRFLLFLALLMFPTMADAVVAKHGTLTHDGVEREYYLYVPKNVENPPLVIALHGMGGNAKNMRFGIGLSKRGYENGFAVIYPQGLRLPRGARHWNAGFDYETAVDDVGYLAALINHTTETHGIDKTKVFVLGFSMGGYMAYHMGCQSPLPLVGIASVAGRISGRDWKNCPANPRPNLLHVHGVDDPVISYGSMEDWGDTWGGAPSVPFTTADWARTLGASPVHVPPEEGLIQRFWRNDATGKKVHMVALQDYGHDWPSLPNGGYSAVDTIVDFFGLRKETPSN